MSQNAEDRGVLTMNLTIRPIRFEGAVFPNELRTMDGTRETKLRIRSERITRSEDYIRGLGSYDHVPVAEITENITCGSKTSDF